LLLAGFPITDKTEKSLVLQSGLATGFLSLTQDGPQVKALRIMLSLVSNPGNSGGPVFDSSGNVVGLLEGNLPSPIRDEMGKTLTYKRQKTDAAGHLLTDENHNPILEEAPLQQNSGISLSVPARLIEKLAKENNINLE